MKMRFKLNGEWRDAEAEENMRALDFLRDVMGITSVKEGCGEGECGACTIIVDGKTVPSCLMLAVELDGKDVMTLEGIDDRIKEAFIEAGAIQCGFCTPGFIVSTGYLLGENLEPDDEEIKTALEGNLCRCTGYLKIIDAVKLASDMIKGDDSK